MSKTITIQPANTPTGDYDVSEPLPYPFHIDAETGDVGRQDFWKGDPLRLIGFQSTAETQRVDVHFEDFAAYPESAVDRFPVFVRADGTIYSMTNPIRSVTAAG